MTAYRTGYGTGPYGAKAYGLDGSFVVGAAVASANATVSPSASVKRAASAAISASLVVTPVARTVQVTSAAVVINVTLTPNGRRKWEPEPDTPEIWNTISPASGIWSDAPSAPEIWTEVA